MRYNTSTTGVVNTGNDMMRDPINCVNVIATVWDASAPGIGWDDFNGNSGYTGK